MGAALNPIERIVGGTFVINLAHRTDRWEQVQAELAKVGYESYERLDAYGVQNLPPERYTSSISAFEMTGWFGNKFSHYRAIELAKERGWDAVMVFEDDVVLHPEFNTYVTEAIEQLASRQWDWLQFGGNHKHFTGWMPRISHVDGMPYLFVKEGLHPVTPRLARIDTMLTAHAYIVKSAVYDFILSHAITSELSIDTFYAYEVHPRFRCYCVTPCVANQSPGVNDIGGCYSDYRDSIGD